MKKVLVNYIGKRGGGPAFALEFAKALANNGFETYAVMSKYVDNKAEWDACSSLKEVYYVKTNKKSGKLYYIWAQLKFMLWEKWKLKRHFRKITFDYVITTMQHLWSVDISKTLKKESIVWVCHDPIPHSGSSKMDGYLGKKFAEISDRIVVLTKQFIPVVHERWNVPTEKIRYMPHGRQKMYALPENAVSRYQADKYNFVFFGYLRDYKGLRVLAKAYAKLSNMRDDVTLTVAGSGDFSKYETDFAGLKNVTVDNRYIADEEVGSYFYGENVITVMPYLDATQSGVSLTAMEYGSVVIASDTGGLKAQLNEGEIGAYCKAGDVDSLFEQMLYVIENPKFVEEQKQKMQAYLQEIEWDNVVKKLMQEM